MKSGETKSARGDYKINKVTEANKRERQWKG